MSLIDKDRLEIDKLKKKKKDEQSKKMIRNMKKIFHRKGNADDP